MFVSENRYDYGLASLFFHVINQSNAVFLLEQLLNSSNTVFVCAISKPLTLKQKIVLWFDQRLTNHFSNFSTYKKNGYFKGILDKIDRVSVKRYDTSIAFVTIYELKK